MFFCCFLVNCRHLICFKCIQARKPLGNVQVAEESETQQVILHIPPTIVEPPDYENLYP